MLNLYQNAPKQTRARDAINRLKLYFERQGITEREPLPNMQMLVDYCLKYPRLLRVRDSPLKYLHDPNLPYAVVHEWYVGVALDYLETSLYLLLEQWESEYRKKRNDERQIADLFAKMVNDVHRCYEHTGLALSTPFPEGCALAAAELKEKVRNESIALIQSKLSFSFKCARKTFYRLALRQFELLYRANYPSTSFSYLFSQQITKYEDRKLESKVQIFLDTQLPNLVDIFNLSNDILEDALERGTSNDEHNDLALESWLPCKATHEKYDIEKLEGRIETFALVCEQLNRLKQPPNWIEILKEATKDRLNTSEWESNWTVPMVQIQVKWLHVLVLPWLSYLMPKSEDKNVNWYTFLREKIKAEHVLYEVIYQSRIPHIFSIILEYPASECAIQDFHIVATKRGLLNDLRDKLMQELRERLLHQGASAVDILQMYIACIRSLSIIDPSCDIMAHVIDLVENYMKNYRNDVIPGVVELIRNAEDYSLLHVEDEDIYAFKKSELNNEEAPNDTIIIKEDKPAQLRRLQEKSKDSIAMLICVCSSLEDFIKGYSKKLGEALLSTNNYDTDTEVRRLELLKRNFPPDSFLSCDIMLRDVDDSRRLDKSIHNNREISPSFHALIISRKYWPDGEESSDDDDSDDSDKSNNFTVWPKYQSSVDEYDKEFRQARKSRRLKFLPSKGSVTLNLEFASKSLTIDVAPEAASVIGLFETRDQLYTKDEIAKLANIDRIAVVESLEFWLKKDILELSADGHYQLVEE